VHLFAAADVVLVVVEDRDVDLGALVVQLIELIEEDDLVA
jgi:hypothetical protein